MGSLLRPRLQMISLILPVFFFFCLLILSPDPGGCRPVRLPLWALAKKVQEESHSSPRAGDILQLCFPCVAGILAYLHE